MLDAGENFDGGGYIQRMPLANSQCLSDIIRMQTAGQNQRVGMLYMPHQFPIEAAACTPIDTGRGLGIQQHRTIVIGDARRIRRITHRYRLDDPARLRGTEGRRLIAMQLQHIQRTGLQNGIDLVLHGIHKQTDSTHEWRQGTDDAGSRRWLDIARGSSIKHKAERIRTESGGA